MSGRNIPSLLGPGLRPATPDRCHVSQAQAQEEPAPGSPGKALSQPWFQLQHEGPTSGQPSTRPASILMALPMHQMERKTGRWMDGPAVGACPVTTVWAHP